MASDEGRVKKCRVLRQPYRPRHLPLTTTEGRGLLFRIEPIPALTAAKVDLANIPLIYREDLTGMWPASAVTKTAPLLCQHGAGEQQVATGTALTAGPLTGRKLSQDIPFLEMNQSKTSQFATDVKHKAGILKHLANSAN